MAGGSRLKRTANTPRVLNRAEAVSQTATGSTDVNNEELAKAIVHLTNRMDALYDLVQAPLEHMKIHSAGSQELAALALTRHMNELRMNLERQTRAAVAEIKRARLGYFEADDE